MLIELYDRTTRAGDLTRIAFCFLAGFTLADDPAQTFDGFSITIYNIPIPENKGQRMTLFENLLGVVKVAGALILSPVLRSWYNRRGATNAEITQALPGDELVPSPMLGYTRAITIRAPAARVWPWLAQMGQGRGGLYSYDGLENLVGCDIHSVDRIIPELQDPQVGELIRLGPKGFPCFAVTSVDGPHSLVLLSADPLSGQPVENTEPRGKGYSIATWQFVLEPLDKNTTRFLVRQRLSYSPDLGWVWRLTEPVGFIMERKMMLGIQRRAERNLS